MVAKITGWMTLGLSLLAILWSTWPRMTAQAPKARAAFLSYSDPWIDSVLSNSDAARLPNQRFALWITNDSSADPLRTADLVQKHQVGAVWFQGFDQPAFQQYRTLINKQPGIPRLIGSLPSAQLSSMPALPAGLALAGLSSASGILPFSSTILSAAKDNHIAALGIPSLTQAYAAGREEGMIYPATQLAEHTSSANILPILWEADQWSEILTTDSLRRDELLAPYLAWMAHPMAMWVIQEPDHFAKSADIAAIVSLLRKKCDFQGIIVGRLRQHATLQGLQAAAAKMLASGVDMMLLRPDELSLFDQEQQSMLQAHSLDIRSINTSVRNILQAKAWAGNKYADTAAVAPDPQLTWQLQAITEASASLVQAEGGPLPIHDLMDRTIHVIGMGQQVPDFLNTLRKYAPVSTSKGSIHEPWFTISTLKIVKYDPLVLVFGQDFPVNEEAILMWRKIKEIGDQTPVILVNLGDPNRMKDAPASLTVLQGYDNGTLGQFVTAQMLAGGLPVVGRFPQDLNDRFFVGGESKTTASRLAYGPAESIGIDSRLLSKIDSIAWEGISELAMPGAQILVAKNGRVIYDKSLGYHTYLRRRGVYPTDLYDVASVTKAAATTLAAMSMYDQGKLALDVPIRKYFRDPYVWRDSVSWLDTLYLGPNSSPPDILSEFDSLYPSFSIPLQSGLRRDTTFLDGDSILVVNRAVAGRIHVPSSAFGTTLFELLTHTSGLPPGIPMREFFRGKRTWKNNKLYFSAKADAGFSIPVARDLYLRSDMADSIWSMTKNMTRRDKPGYKYSDANLILVQRVIDSLNRESMDKYLERTWYSPLGLQNTCFRPYERFDMDRIVPTEYDKRYRAQALQGYVHDPTAALMGGISGNAGLFSTANDLSIIAQMWLQEGRYGGRQWVKAETVRKFTQTQAGHRGLGFDKPTREGESLIAPSASPLSYGHTGFTGALIWVDPAEDLVFIFLSNRVHPNANNWLLNKLAIRQRAHEAVYEAIRQSRQETLAFGAEQIRE
ncbi:MAG: serine hydrolase [Bacteroidia bacterium]|nr:serine hydrolase [Bacteroidia bacterium]